MEFGKGCLKTLEHIKAKHFRLGAEGVRVIDWATPYSVENGFTLNQRNQNGSLSCTAQATSYYNEALDRIELNESENYSARFLYSQTFIPPDGGSYIWKAMAVPLKIGVVDAIIVPDGLSSENEMRDNTLNGTAPLKAKFDKYALIPSHDINYLAQIVEDYHGFVTGFDGNNTITQQAILGIPDHVDWSHAVYVCGHEVLPDGRKALKFKNSWGSLWGNSGYGYFTEDFVKSGYMFDAYVYASITDLDPLSMPLVLARDSKDPASGKVYALLETKKVKCWVINPEILELGHGDMWGGFDSVISKDLSGYKDGNISINVAT